jgi:membrane fusion protein (multidrug efflux system)
MSNNSLKISPLSAIVLALVCVALPACKQRAEEAHEEAHKVVVTTPVKKDVVLTQQYVCQIHSCRHIEMCALENGYLEAIPVKEGQKVKQGDTLFTILPTLYQAKLDAEVAEVQLAQIRFDNTQRLFQQNVVAKPEVDLARAELAKAQAKVALVRAELNFTNIKAPFDGIIDHQNHQQGSLIAEGDMLTTLSDNSVMWVYFNVPEARYLEYQANEDKDKMKIELRLANGNIFPHLGKIGAIEADFNNETGNIAFRADFSNPEGLLRYGQTGTILLSHVEKDALVIPQRCTYEILAKKYVYVVGEPGEEPKRDAEGAKHGEEHGAEKVAKHEGKHAAEPAAKHGEEKVAKHGAEHGEKHAGKVGVARQREIVIQNELDDIYLIKEGVGVQDKIVLEGVRQLRDGNELEYELLPPEKALSNLKYHAE